ncbi:MFS transporter [uncultured Anaerococcus sp.]|uniref:MFS transporter n=1 Tax=uncultured Anaerococcus sp. TaxID=293428 RepID=UPI0025F59F1D|nr:MFS transporter [uncultured Anaerococcus sp.]
MNEQKNLKIKSVIIEGLMFLAYAFFAVNWIAGSKLTPNILNAFNVEGPHAVSLINNVVTLAKILGNLIAATIFAKLFPKKSIGLASLLIPAGAMLAALSQSFPVFLIGRFIMGFGGALFVVYFSPVVVNYFHPDQRPVVNALNNVSYNVGSILALLLIGPVIKLLGLGRWALVAFAIVSFIIFALWLIFGENFEISSTKASGSVDFNLKDAFKEKIAIIMPTMYFGHLTLYMVMLNIFPNTNFSPIPASKISTLFTTGALIGTLLSIIVAKKSTKRVPTLKVSGILTTIIAIALINSTNATLSTILALALGTIMYVPLTNFVLIPQEIPGMYSEKLTQIMSVYWSLVYILETIAYQIIVMIQHSAGEKTALMATAILSATFIIGSFIIKEPKDL